LVQKTAAARNSGADHATRFRDPVHDAYSRASPQGEPAGIKEEATVFSHVMIGTNDLEAAKAFYDKLLGTLGVPPGAVDRHRVFYRTKTGTFSVSKPINGEPATPANGGTIGFAAGSAAEVDAWHAIGVATGATTCEDPPGLREMGPVKLHLAYLRDPDGNKLCAMYRLPKEPAA
jgi:catechol 2,3-dioxygenase-like lactoylglutathione lyase family enzyme